jgi:hypothetical protein
MASTGAATGLAPTRLIVGPLSTPGGFQYWYLACFPDCVVAVQQSIGAFFVLGMSNSAGGAFGLIGIVIKSLLQPRAQAFRQRIEAALQSTSSARLQVEGDCLQVEKRRPFDLVGSSAGNKNRQQAEIRNYSCGL